jgi:hypothetical protein
MKMENANVKDAEMDWDRFEIQSDARVKIETGKKYEMGFSAVKQDEIEVTDKEKTAEGSMEVKKKIPVLILAVDYYDNKPAKRELVVTSKRLVQVIRTYFEKGLLFRKMFELKKDGEGFQTHYSMIALDDKPHAPPPTQSGGVEEKGKQGAPASSSPGSPDGIGSYTR